MELIETAEELNTLPDYTVVVAAEAEVDGATVTIAMQKIGGDWFAVGVPMALPPTFMELSFFPAKVVYRL